MYVLGIIAGIITGMSFWFAASFALASSILWIDSRYPRFAASKRMRAGEAAACATLVLLCFAVAFAVARVIIQN